jgi:hypothetical protein
MDNLFHKQLKTINVKKINLEAMVKNNFLLVVLLLLIIPNANAQMQADHHDILLMGMNDGDKITLRWRLANYADYELARRSSFIVEQKILDKDQSFSKVPFKQIEKIEVADKQSFLTNINEQINNRSLIACASILYPDNSSTINKKNISGHIDLVNKLNQQHSILLLQADLDRTSSKLLGLRYEQTDIDPTKNYFYRIIVDGEDGAQLRSNIIKIEGDLIHQLPAPDISEVIESDSLITLKWNKEKHDAFYIAYLIERAGSSGEFKHVVSLPFIYSEDPLLDLNDEHIQFNHYTENNVSYNYRIRGISPFGEISNYSNTVEATARDITPPNLPDSLWLSYKEGNVLVSWAYEINTKSSDLQITHIERSTMVDSKFKEIGLLRNSTSSVNNYTDLIDDSNPYYFYRLRLTDKNNNSAYTNPVSVQIPDTIPPAIPSVTSATIDSLGNIKLTWKNNQEKDLLGYQIYSANREDGMYTNLINNAYQDNEWSTTIDINYLNEDIFFKLQSLDRHYNHSPLSDPIKLIIPDKVPPLPGYFKDYFVGENTIEFQWQKSNSEDLTSQRLLRRISGEKEWTELQILDTNTEQYKDDDTKQGIIYEYNIVSVDKHNNETYATDMLRLKAIGTIRLEAVKNFTLTYNTDTKSVDLNWGKSTENIRNYVIYRSVNDGSYRSLSTIKAETFQYKDYKISEGKNYKYYIIAISKKGKKTQKSIILNHIS